MYTFISIYQYFHLYNNFKKIALDDKRIKKKTAHIIYFLHIVYMINMKTN